VFELSAVPTKVAPITSKERGAPARRPGYCVLGGVASQALGCPSLRPWRDALAAYLAERSQRQGK